MDLRPMKAKTLKSAVPLRIAGVLIDLFSRIGKRDPPAPHKTQHCRLISIAVSNYVEKARWGLDLLEEHSNSHLYYTEDFHAPVLHAFHSVDASKDQASQSPMVVLPDGSALWGSDIILRHLCKEDDIVNLYPTEIEQETMKLEQDLGVRLGASARAFGYHCLFDKSKQYYEAATEFLTPHCPKIEQFVFSKMLDNGLARGMIKSMNITEEVGDVSEKEIREVFDEMSQRLEHNGGEYLMNKSGKQYGFTAADLSLAALSYSLVRPPEMQPFLVPDAKMPPKLVQLGEELRGTRAGKHVLKLYRDHRPIAKTTGKVVIRKMDQDRVPWKEIAGVTTLIGTVLLGLMSLKRT